MCRFEYKVNFLKQSVQRPPTKPPSPEVRMCPYYSNLHKSPSPANPSGNAAFLADFWTYSPVGECN